VKSFLDFLNEDEMKRHPLDAESGPQDFDIAAVHDHIDDHGGIPITDDNIEKHGISFDEIKGDDRIETTVRATKGKLSGRASELHVFKTPTGDTVHALFPQPSQIGGQAYVQHQNFLGRRVYQSGVGDVIRRYGLPEEKL
tara:strand:- start:59 stop:478 length:420 start_codon:yes stop_codon:yes gene_type:complete